ncbi:Cationic amino acid transporter-1 [Rhizophlyctis rosea]|nr:Cationic amino acid transporter-1 [Rhizophlyctis rosea]
MATLTTATLCALLAALLPIDILANLTSIGTLFAFALVSLSVPILRCKTRHAPPPPSFRISGGNVMGGVVIPLLSAGCCVGLMGVSGGMALVRLVGWWVVGMVVYVGYGWRKSRLRRGERGEVEEEVKLEVVGESREGSGRGSGENVEGSSN